MLRPLFYKYQQYNSTVIKNAFHIWISKRIVCDLIRFSSTDGKFSLKQESYNKKYNSELCRGRKSIDSSYRNKHGGESCNEKNVCVGKPSKWPSGKREGFKFHEETEAVFNKQINVEFKAFYYYLSMAAFFGRVDVALPGCESFFWQMHHEEHEHALRFLNYVKMRGGCVHLCAINPPTDQDWKCPLHAFKTALELEIEVSERLVEANCVAEKHGDLNACDFIITGFMEDQMKSVNEMARFKTILSGIGDQSLARFIFDKDLLDNYVLRRFNILKGKSDLNPKEK